MTRLIHAKKRKSAATVLSDEKCPHSNRHDANPSMCSLCHAVEATRIAAPVVVLDPDAERALRSIALAKNETDRGGN